MRRPSATVAICPRAMACIITLPMAVASTGPATTGRCVASAANWHSSRFCEPPPDDVDRAEPAPGHALELFHRPAVLERQALQRAAYDLAARLGHALAGAGAKSLDAAGHLARAR